MVKDAGVPTVADVVCSPRAVLWLAHIRGGIPTTSVLEAATACMVHPNKSAHMQAIIVGTRGLWPLCSAGRSLFRHAFCATTRSDSSLSNAERRHGLPAWRSRMDGHTGQDRAKWGPPCVWASAGAQRLPQQHTGTARWCRAAIPCLVTCRRSPERRILGCCTGYRGCSAASRHARSLGLRRTVLAQPTDALSPTKQASSQRPGRQTRPSRPSGRSVTLRPPQWGAHRPRLPMAVAKGSCPARAEGETGPREKEKDSNREQR